MARTRPRFPARKNRKRNGRNAASRPKVKISEAKRLPSARIVQRRAATPSRDLKPPWDTAAERSRWGARLYASAHFPDERLRTRAIAVTETLAAKPADSIPQACDSWASTKAAYRLIENDRVTFEMFERAVADYTARACAGHREVLAVQDTTSLSFPTAHATTGLGPVNDSSVQGLHLHSALATREDGVPIGFLHQYVWAREREKLSRTNADRKKKRIEEKESFKWIRAMRGAREVLARNLSEDLRPRIVHVGDCENDVHEVFEDILSAGDSMVIRSGQNRRVQGPDGRLGLAHDVVRQSRLLGKTRIAVPRKQGNAARKANLEYRAVRVALAPASTHHPERRPIPLTLVEVWEPRPPKGVEPLHWLLWTARTVTNLKQALRIAEMYKTRWKIEEVHLVLKSGCRIEDVRFETADRIRKAIALYSPIAARIVQLRDLARIEPESPATIVLGDDEWRALWTYIKKKPPPRSQSPPTLREAVLWIGRLGGHLGRKSDGMPGVRTLWRGWRDLDMLSTLYATLHP